LSTMTIALGTRSLMIAANLEILSKGLVQLFRRTKAVFVGCMRGEVTQDQ